MARHETTPGAELIPSSPEDVVALMREVVRAAQGLTVDWARESRLNQTDFRALVRIVASDGMTMAELRRAIGITSASMVELTDRLEQGRLVTRSRPLPDRRLVLLTPTARGRRIVDRALGPILTSLLGIVVALEPERLTVVATFLGAVADAVGYAALPGIAR